MISRLEDSRFWWLIDVGLIAAYIGTMFLAMYFVFFAASPH